MNQYRDAFKQVKSVVVNAADAVYAVDRITAKDRAEAKRDGTRLSAEEISDYAEDLISLAYHIMSQIDEDDLNAHQEEVIDRLERSLWYLKDE